MRAFLFFICYTFIVTVFAQQPEVVIGATVDTSSLKRIDTLKPAAPVIIINKTSQQANLKIDTLTASKHSPKKATILSMVLPGAGQVYNRKNWWWKVPIIYGGGAALVYGAIFYNKYYLEYRRAYEFTVLNPGVPTGNPRFDQFNDKATLIAYRDSYRDSRDQCIIGLGLLYILQIVDASVEAHFFDFNVNENLSLNIQPQFVLNQREAYSGIQFTLKLK